MFYIENICLYLWKNIYYVSASSPSQVQVDTDGNKGLTISAINIILIFKFYLICTWKDLHEKTTFAYLARKYVIYRIPPSRLYILIVPTVSLATDSVTRIGSIEVVTPAKFQALLNLVEELLKRTGGAPLPTMPSNEDLLAELAKGTASLTDTMEAMQVLLKI